MKGNSTMGNGEKYGENMANYSQSILVFCHFIMFLPCVFPPLTPSQTLTSPTPSPVKSTEALLVPFWEKLKRPRLR